MGRKSATVQTYVDVEIDIDDFDSDDLIDELERRGYTVLDEKETKVYETDSDRVLWLIRQSYITDTPENFRKFLGLKFLDMDMPA